MSSKLKVGVVGTGNIFQGHAPTWASHKEAELAAFCDFNIAAADTAAQKYGVTQIYQDYKELLANPEIDIVDICAPNLYHSEVAIAALQAGKHVLVEKPEAINPAEAHKMAEAAKASGKLLMAIRNNRFRSSIQFLKKYIEKGHMGEIYTGRCGWLRRRCMGPIGWFTNKSLSGGGPLIDLGVHYIDVAVWLMGNPKPVSVVGSAYNKFGQQHLQEYLDHHQGENTDNMMYDVEDLATGFIRFENGASLQIEFSWASHVEHAHREFVELRGTKAGFNYDNNNLKIFTEIEGAFCDIYPRLPEDIGGHSGQINHFVECVLNRAQPIISPEDGVDMIKILFALYESARTGFEVRL